MGVTSVPATGRGHGDLPSLAPGATSLLDVTITDSRQGDLAKAYLAIGEPPSRAGRRPYPALQGRRRVRQRPARVAGPAPGITRAARSSAAARCRPR